MNIFKAKIKNKKIIAKDTLWVEFDVSPNKIEFKPGQFFFVRLTDPMYTDMKGNQRHFSIVNSPARNDVLEMATRLRETAFKKSLNQMAIGSQVEVFNIAGNFCLPEDNSKSLVWIAGGIGITPFMSMLGYIGENNLDYQITLLYSNRDRRSTAFLDELNELEPKMDNFKLVPTMTDDEMWRGENQMIDRGFIKKYISNLKENIFMVVGPPGMVEGVGKLLGDMNIEKENIRTEQFSGY